MLTSSAHQASSTWRLVVDAGANGSWPVDKKVSVGWGLPAGCAVLLLLQGATTGAGLLGPFFVELCWRESGL